MDAVCRCPRQARFPCLSLQLAPQQDFRTRRNVNLLLHSTFGTANDPATVMSLVNFCVGICMFTVVPRHVLVLSCTIFGVHFSRVYAYTSDGDGAAGGGEAVMPAQNDFKARLAMFKKKETGPAQGSSA